jgi:alpha-1,3-mannosyl-glycoprotein beta-1,2-N-acetylglucosaminyltransferase
MALADDWDDWMRHANVSVERQCVFPEVSRTHTFGEEGTHLGEHFAQHLKTMLLNEERIDWMKKVSC